jgi:hypothetical protein
MPQAPLVVLAAFDLDLGQFGGMAEYQIDCMS